MLSLKKQIKNDEYNYLTIILTLKKKKKKTYFVIVDVSSSCRSGVWVQLGLPWRICGTKLSFSLCPAHMLSPNVDSLWVLVPIGPSKIF